MSFTHDPAAVLDYALDWSTWLADGETVTAATWVVPAGLTQSAPSPSHTGTSATIWVTGGTVGQSYRLTNHITTSQGRQDERSITLVVRDR